MKLFTGRISPNGKRVLVCAAELGVPLEPVRLDFQKGENRLPDYLALNPMGKVPTVVEGPLVLWESAAIIWHLAAQHDAGGRLLPRDAHAQADAMRWMFFGACHLDGYFTTLVVERFIKARREVPSNEVLAGAAEKDVARFVGVLDQHLAGREYVTGRFGLADITLGCTLELSPLVKYDLSPYPYVRAWLERLQARDSWRAASA